MAGRRQKGEGSVYHRKTRSQWVAVADLGWKNGKRDRREFTGATPEAAIEKRTAFLARRRGGFTLPRGRQPTVAEWALHWVHHIAKTRVGPQTWVSYRQKTEDYIAPYFERVKLAELTREDVEAWHGWLSARRPARRRGSDTLAPSTVTTAHHIFSVALNEAVDRGHLPRNPCTRTPPPRADRLPPEPPSAAELDMVLAACRDWPNGARWVLAVTTGLRQGEALGLRWRDIRLTDPAAVTVRQSQARVDGQWLYKSPKSAKSRRTVPLPAVAVAALKAHRERQAVADIGGLVFTRPEGPWHAKRDWRDWQDLLASIGLPRYRVHDCRHAFATELLEQGEDPRVVQELLGWSTARMAEIYQHVRPATHARVVASLDKRFGG